MLCPEVPFFSNQALELTESVATLPECDNNRFSSEARICVLTSQVLENACPNVQKPYGQERAMVTDRRVAATTK